MSTRAYIYYGQPPLRGPRLRCRVACTASLPIAVCEIRGAVTCVAFVAVDVGGIDRECEIFGAIGLGAKIACEAAATTASATLRPAHAYRCKVTTGERRTCVVRLKRAAPACDARVSLATRKAKIKPSRRETRIRGVCTASDFYCTVRGRTAVRCRVTATATPPRYACEVRGAVSLGAKITCAGYTPRPFRIKGW